MNCEHFAVRIKWFLEPEFMNAVVMVCTSVVIRSRHLLKKTLRMVINVKCGIELTYSTLFLFRFKVCGSSFSLSWVFNKGDRIHVTSLHLLWQEKNYTCAVDSSSNQEHAEGKL